MLVSVSRLFDQARNVRKIDGFAIGHLSHQASPTTHPTSLILPWEPRFPRIYP